MFAVRRTVGKPARSHVGRRRQLEKDDKPHDYTWVVNTPISSEVVKLLCLDWKADQRKAGNFEEKAIRDISFQINHQ